MNKRYYTCLFGGEAGYGVMSAGAMIAKGANRSGLWSFVVNEYPSLIKGGLNSCLTRLSNQPLTAYEEPIDFLGIFSDQAFDCHAHQLGPKTIVLYDSANVTIDQSKVPAGTVLYPISLTEYIPTGGTKIMGNSAMLGAFCALTGYPLAVLIAVLKDEFHSEKLQKQNIAILEQVYAHVLTTLPIKNVFPLEFQQNTSPKMLINGNEAISLAAIKAGCKF